MTILDLEIFEISSKEQIKNGRVRQTAARFQLLDQELQDRAHDISCSEQVGSPGLSMGSSTPESWYRSYQSYSVCMQHTFSLIIHS